MAGSGNQGLIEKAKSGNRAAFEEFCRVRQQSILVNALGILGNKADAEDAAQEAILLVYRNLRQLRDNDAVDAWIYQITRRCCYAVLRRRKERVNDVEIDAAALDFEEGDESLLPETRAVNEDLKNAVTQAVMQLPAKCREAVFLYYYNDMSVKEIARLTKRNVNSVTSILSRARVIMRAQLEQQNPDMRSALSGAAASLGGILKETLPEWFPPNEIARFEQGWLQALGHAKAPISAGAHLLRVAAGIIIGAVALAGGMHIATEYRIAHEAPTTSVVTTIGDREVAGAVVFEGGDCECGHANPKTAILAKEDETVVSMSWEVLNTENAVQISGSGTRADGLSALRAGRYMLVFTGEDEAGTTFRITREFENTGFFGIFEK